MANPFSVVVVLGPQGPEVREPRAPLVRADDVGVLRGDGVFERFIVYRARPRHLDDHLERLARSAHLMELELPPAAQWRAAVACAIGIWLGPEEWEMRLVCTRGPEEGGPPTAYVLGQELPELLKRQRAEGISVVSAYRGYGGGWPVSETPWLLLGAKTLSYALNQAAKRYAQSRGADDVIFVGPEGGVFEGSTSAVVAAFGRRLVSPPASIGILDSISTSWLLRSAAARGWRVARQELSLDSLLAADGVWLSSSLKLARVHTLDGKTLAPAPAHDELAQAATRF